MPNALLYFIPHSTDPKGFRGTGLPAAEIARLGLAAQFSGVKPQVRGCSRGPFGRGSGIIAAVDTLPPERFTLDLDSTPARQEWEPFGEPETAEVFVGRWTDGEAPGPDDLAKPETVAGHLVRLGDDRDWLIPVARDLSGRSRLPGSLRLGPRGELVKKELPRFAALSADAGRIAQALIAGAESGAAIVLEDAFAIACSALAVNYRLGPGGREVGFLGLLTDANIRTVLEALIDLPTLLAIAAERDESQKKSEPGSTPPGSATSAGAAASSALNTTPPSPTSPSSNSNP